MTINRKTYNEKVVRKPDFPLLVKIEFIPFFDLFDLAITADYRVDPNCHFCILEVRIRVGCFIIGKKKGYDIINTSIC